MAHQTFSHDIVKELHNGDSTIRVIVEQLGINSGCEKLSEEQKKKQKTSDTFLRGDGSMQYRVVSLWFAFLTCTWAQLSHPLAGRLHN